MLLAGKPVAGVAVSVDGWIAPATDKAGAFTYPVDITMPDRHIVEGRERRRARRSTGKPLTRRAGERAVLAREGRDQHGLQARRPRGEPGSDGTVVVTGRLTYGTEPGAAARVGLYSYLLKGTDHVCRRSAPVKGAVVTTRTNDHEFWTYSTPAGRDGRYAAFLVAADQEGDDPVPMTVGVAVGNDAYAEPLNDFVDFAKLKSASLDIQLPAAAGARAAEVDPQPADDRRRHLRGPARRRRRARARDQAA